MSWVDEEPKQIDWYQVNTDCKSPLHYVIKFLRDSLLMEDDAFGSLRVLDASFYPNERGFIYKYKMAFDKNNKIHNLTIIYVCSLHGIEERRIEYAMLDGVFDIIRSSNIQEYDLKGIQHDTNN